MARLGHLLSLQLAIYYASFVSLVLSLYFPLSRNREYVVFSIYIKIKHPLVNDDIVIQRLDFYSMIAVEQGYVEALERLSAPMIHLPFLGVVILLHLADYRLCAVNAYAYAHILLIRQIARDGGEGESRISYAAAYESVSQDGSLWQLHGVVAMTQQRFQLDLLRSSIFAAGAWKAFVQSYAFLAVMFLVNVTSGWRS